jgi:hypothetical protein
VKRLSWSVSVLLASLAAVLLLGVGQPGASRGFKGQIAKQAATGTLRAPVLTMRRNGRTVKRTLPFISASTATAAQDVVSARDERAEAADKTAEPADQGFPDIGQAEGTLGCSRRDRPRSGSHNRGGANVRVNQDCTFRRQAETEITYNPAQPSNLVAGQNDSRVGYNQCGIDWSLDNGAKWGDLLPPFRQRTNTPELMGPNADNPNNNTIMGDPGTGHTYDAGSDPALAVDSKGRSYFSCVTFDVASNASGLYVTQSPRGADGSFYYNVPDSPEKRFMVVEDNSPVVFHDKNFIAADFYKHSPNRDNVYVTWTVFKFGATCVGGSDTAPAQCESPIFGSMSTDHGITWSTPEEISGASDAYCSFGNVLDPSLPENKCNLDQGSDPVVLPNGHLQVIFNNGNTAEGNPNAQQLGVHCKPAGSSTNGTAHLHCASPSKVGEDIIAGEPVCDFGRGPEECVPGPFIRTNDFPRIVTENTQNNHLYATWQDYRNGEYDIQMSRSLDGGLTWHEAGTVNPDRGLDHYFPAVDQSPDGNDRVGVSYYRSERVPGESSGAVFYPCDEPNPGAPSSCTGVAQGDSDYVLAGGSGVGLPYAFRPVSPVFPPPDGVQAGFNGDYSGLTINRGAEAHPFWSDTRNVDPYSPANGVVHDEDGFTDTLSLPGGRGSRGEGRLGKG